MQLGDLTTLASVQTWLSSQGSTAFTPQASPILGQLITRASAWAQNYMNRTIPPRVYTQTFNGYDTPSMMLPQRPIISILSLTQGGVVISPSNPPTVDSGYVFDQSLLYLRGQCFWRAPQNITVSWVAGFQTGPEAIVAPTNGGHLNVSSLLRPWNADRGVVYASSGIALTLVAANPAVGQYAVLADATTAQFYYQFSTADGNAALQVTYGYTPEDLEQAVVEIVGESFKRRSRIGETSFNLGHGQVVSLLKEALNETAKMTLDQYRTVTPVQGATFP